MIQLYKERKMPDIIGDIHGAFDALEMLFRRLGYVKRNGIYRHPERYPVFVGDYIDRGDKVLETLQLIRSMQESDNAITLMGNHEYNYLCLQTESYSGKMLRENSENNLKQVAKTNSALFKPQERKSYLKWMSELPLIAESAAFRVVHAQWNDKDVSMLRLSGIKKLNRENLNKIHNDNALKSSVEIILKGKEVELPRLLHYQDYEGHARDNARISWWKKKNGDKLGDIFASLPQQVAEKKVGRFKHDFNEYYPKNERPVFFGHYWLPPSDFGLTADNACCVDFSIAKYGLLAAYRFNGEKKLSPKNLIKHY